MNGSKVGRRLTRNIEGYPVATFSGQLPDSHTWNFPEESFKVANKYQKPKGMCFAVTMKRVEKAYKDQWNISDAIIVNTKHEDYRFSGTISPAIDDKYFGYGVGGALAKNGYADLISHEDVWNGKLEEGAMIQYWNNENEVTWETLKAAIKSSIGARPHPNFSGGHSVIFKSYEYDTNGNITKILFYDYAGIHRKFEEIDIKKKDIARC